MACCGTSKKIENSDELFKKLRNNNEIISFKLNDLILKFAPEKSKWDSK